jgi:aryl-alcohol dehydrogenase-like predicted oxidoreductase
LVAAKDLGINFIDTADVYSDGRSEQMIGDALINDRERWIIASKVGVRSTESGHGIGAKKVIFKRVEDSLRRLRTDYIDIYQLHRFDPETPVIETIEAMDSLCTQGKVRFFGLSNFDVQQSVEFLDAASGARLLMPATNQVHHNLFKRQIVHQFGKMPESFPLKLLVYGALGRGILAGKYRQGELPSERSRAYVSASVKGDLQPVVFEAVAGLNKIALKAGISMSQLAVAHVLRTKAVLSALVGIRTVAQLSEVSQACTWDLSSDFWKIVDDYVLSVEDLDHVSLGKPILA